MTHYVASPPACGRSAWCGPTAVTILTGCSYETAEQTILRMRDSRGQRSTGALRLVEGGRVRGSTIWEVVDAIDTLLAERATSSPPEVLRPLVRNKYWVLPSDAPTGRAAATLGTLRKYALGRKLITPFHRPILVHTHQHFSTIVGHRILDNGRCDGTSSSPARPRCRVINAWALSGDFKV